MRSPTPVALAGALACGLTAVRASAAPRRARPRACEVALAHSPDKELSFIAFPGTAFSSPHHYTFFLRGKEPLTSKLLQPVMIDARTAELTAAPELPWYLAALLVSQPLHFGDYGGMPMKILWALLDIATIVVLGSGLYIWLKRRQPRALVEEAEVEVEPAADEPLGAQPRHARGGAR